MNNIDLTEEEKQEISASLFPYDDLYNQVWRTLELQINSLLKDRYNKGKEEWREYETDRIWADCCELFNKPMWDFIWDIKRIIFRK